MSMDDFTEEELRSKVPINRWSGSDIARMLGRIEVTLMEMRADIQESNQAQTLMLTQVQKIDNRVGALEVKERDRTVFSQRAGRVMLVLLVPMIFAMSHISQWFDGVSDMCYPKNKP
jgi:hypothetical protein